MRPEEAESKAGPCAPGCAGRGASNMWTFEIKADHMSYSLNSLMGGYIGDYIGDYYRGY